MPFVNAASVTGAGGDKIPMAISGGKVRVAFAEFTYATDAQGTYTIPECYFPRGTRVLAVDAMTSVTTGSATLAIGITGTTGKYRAAAAITSADLWVGTGVATVGGGLNGALGVVLTADEQWILTTAGATLPASGKLIIRVLYVDNS
jgi:hypothetical protein